MTWVFTRSLPCCDERHVDSFHPNVILHPVAVEQERDANV